MVLQVKPSTKHPKFLTFLAIDVAWIEEKKIVLEKGGKSSDSKSN